MRYSRRKGISRLKNQCLVEGLLGDLRIGRFVAEMLENIFLIIDLDKMNNGQM
jgi:hypothetical protein